jgi:hypothetical protein
MSSPIVLIIFVGLLFLAFIFIKSIVNNMKDGNKKLGLIKISVSLLVVLGYSWIGNYTLRNNVPVPLSADVKQYTMEVNETKESKSGTKVKLNKVFMDINYIGFTLGIKGKERLVAVEVKKNLEDKEPLKELTGIWIGKRYSYSYGGYGISYKTDKFIDPLYLVCYLSDGEEISFKLQDKKNNKDKTGIIQINKEIDIEGTKLKIKEVRNSLTNTLIHMTSEEGRVYLKAYIIKDGISKELESGSSGGGQHFDYEFYTKPIYEPEVKLKLVPNGSNKEYIVDLE